MQHIDHLRNDQQFVRWDVQPSIERLDELPAYLFTWIGGNVGERFENSLHVIQPQNAVDNLVDNSPIHFGSTKLVLQKGCLRWCRTWTW